MIETLLEDFDQSLAETREENQALERFKKENPDLFQKKDSRLVFHLGVVLSLTDPLFSGINFYWGSYAGLGR